MAKLNVGKRLLYFPRKVSDFHFGNVISEVLQKEMRLKDDAVLECYDPINDTKR